MPVVKLECHKCHGRFTLKAPDLGAMASKTFRCPKCGFQAPFGQLLGIPGRPAPQAQRVPPPVNPLHTHIAGGTRPLDGQPLKTQVASARNIATLTVESTGRRIPIGHGQYTLGRESADSGASIRVAPDPYMSRMQARLDVVAMPGGAQCKIACMPSANPIFVNNSKVFPGESTVLSNGDKIMLGTTYVTITF